MSDLLQRMRELVEDFVRKESRSERVVGIVVFGSFVTERVQESSDVDLIVLMEDLEGYSRTRRSAKGVLLEIHRWPVNLFSILFTGGESNVFQDAFCLGVMRDGRILYDPKGILEQYKRYAKSHRLPHTETTSLANKAKSSLLLAQTLLEKKELDEAEIEIRRAAEELARVLLLENDVFDIVSPKYYLPHLRKKTPDFYRLFSGVHNLTRIQRDEVDAAVQDISKWWKIIADGIRRIGDGGRLRQGGTVRGAETELLNALDCLEKGDEEGAMLQARYSATLLISPVLRLVEGRSADAPGERYINLIRNGHRYGDVVKHVMNFSRDRRRLEEHLQVLTKIVARYL
ncbi:MAG: nucleotidyltransferase domain-containing protein [Candidatus Bathyarchaeota archaeon]|nr:nucleotidyltransferase domain-containing protein [Candidatus Bathyarchaeota archaeon]